MAASNCNCVFTSNQVNLVGPTGRRLTLSAKGHHSLKTAWNSVPDKQAMGEQVFRTIFEHKPLLKRLFGLEGVSGEELSRCKRFERHGYAFGTFLDICVKSLQLDGSYLICLAQNVGKRHANYPETSFDAENWLLFKNTVLITLEPYFFDLKARSVWNSFLMYLIMEIKDAFHAETTRKHSSPAIVLSQKRFHGARCDLFLYLQEQQKLCIEEAEEQKNSNC